MGHVASGAYDIGFGDVNALIRLAGTKPDEAPLCVYQMYNKPPFTVAVLSKSDIMDAKDLEGRKLGGAANDGALKARVSHVEHLGGDTNVIAQVGNHRITARLFGQHAILEGANITLGMAQDRTYHFDESGKRLA